MNRDWVLSIQGGGQKTAFSAGVVDILIKEKIMANEVYGCSAGALVALMYAQQKEGASYDVVIKSGDIRRLLTPISYLFGGSLLNFDWFVDEKKQPNLDKKAIKEGDTTVYAVCTNLNSFEPLYVSSKEEGFYDAVKGSCSLAFFRKKPQMVNNIPTLDGGYVERIPCLRALKEGKKVVVIAAKERGFRFEDLHEKDETKMAKRYKKYPQFVEGYPLNREIFRNQIEELEKLEEEGKIFFIYPPKPIDCALTERNPSKLRAAYLMGIDTAKEILPKLKKYLSE